MGSYPEVNLKEASNSRNNANKLLAGGVDPNENRKAVKSANTERASQNCWHAKKLSGWVASKTLALLSAKAALLSFILAASKSSCSKVALAWRC